MNKSEKNFFFAIFLLVVSIILFINSWIYGIFTLIASFSHLSDSDDFKKIIEKYIADMSILKEEDRKNSSQTDSIVNQLNKNELNAKLKQLNYNRSGFSIMLKLIAVLGIIGYTAYLGYTDYIN